MNEFIPYVLGKIIPDTLSLSITRSIGSTMSSTISFPYALSELLVCGLLLLLLFGVAVHGACWIYKNKLNTQSKSLEERRKQRQEDRAPTPMIMKLCLLLWWMSVLIKAVVNIFTWTDILIPFDSQCYDGHCASCLRRGKLLYCNFAIQISATLVLFYKINSDFQSKKWMACFRALLVFIGLTETAVLVVVSLSECPHIGHVFQLSHSGDREYFVCTFDGKEIGFPMMIPIQYLLCLLTLIVFNAAFILKAYRIWTQSNLHQLQSVEKYQKLDRAITVIVRMIVLSAQLICVLIIRLALFIFAGNHAHYSKSIWMDILIGNIIFMFFPFKFSDAMYKLLFSRIHELIFRKWKARYLEHVQRIAARNLYQFMIQMHKDMFKERPSSSSLRPVFEDERRHKQQEEFEAKYNEELQLSITQVMTSSCHKGTDRDSTDENTYPIDFDFKGVFEQLDAEAERPHDVERNPIDAVAASTIDAHSWSVNGNDVLPLDADNVVLQLAERSSDVIEEQTKV